MMDLKTIGFASLGWLFVAIFSLTSIAISMAGGVWVLVIGLLLVALCAPPVRALMSKKLNFRLTGWPLVIACFCLVAVQGNIAAQHSEKQRIEDAAKAQDELSQRIATQRAADLAYYEAHKSEVLADIAKKLQAGQLQQALAVASKYSAASKDPDIARAKRLVDFQTARAQLKDESTMPLEKRVEIYQTMAQVDPSNAEVVTKAKKLTSELERRQAEAQEVQDRAALQAQRQQRIQAQFSAWDGSHSGVEQAVKSSMKNPDSYKHVETRYMDTGKRIIVTTTIRGTNSFGGVVPSTFTAEVDEVGNVLKLSETR